MESLVVTVIGKDRPGLVESVSAAIEAHGGSWVESRMSHLAGHFAGILRASVLEANVDALTEALEVKAYADAAGWVYETAPETPEGITLATVREVHRRAVGPVWAAFPPTTRDTPGDFRTTGVTVGDSRRVQLSAAPAVHADMTDWAAATAETSGSHPILRIAEQHSSFERIHPFTDGNGRVGRLLANWGLVQADYPPMVIRYQQRERYLRALERADQGNPKGLVELFARAVSESINRFILPRLAGDARIVPLRALAEGSPYSSDYLRQLALSGRLRAVRHGSLWLRDRKSVV